MVEERPDALKQIYFSHVVFELEFQEDLHLQFGALLRLRRELRQAASLMFADESLDREAYQNLFDPPVPVDPVYRKRVQKPGPGFVIRGPILESRTFEAGDSLELPVLFLGRAIQNLPDFARLLQGLGRVGLVNGQGGYELVTIRAFDATGNLQGVWACGEDLEKMAPPILDAAWWLDSLHRDSDSPSVEMTFATPCRLLSKGRPLFRPHFGTIFPFILRRITSIAQVHCGVELNDNPKPLLAASLLVRQDVNSLRWEDWRRLESGEGCQDLGGVLGSLVLSGPPLLEILWILQLGSLLQLGKGAAYGAGCYGLKSAH